MAGNRVIRLRQWLRQFEQKGVTSFLPIVQTLNANNPTNRVFQANDGYLFADSLFVGEESSGHNDSAQVLGFTGIGTANSALADPSFHFIGAGGFGIEAIPNGIAVQTNVAQSGTVIVNGLARLT